MRSCGRHIQRSSVRHEVARLRVDAWIGGSADVVSVFQVRARWPVPSSTCVVRLLVGGVRSSGKSPSGGPFHPGGRRRGEWPDG